MEIGRPGAPPTGTDTMMSMPEIPVEPAEHNEMPGSAAGTARLGTGFWRLWSASATSSLGTGITTAALPLLAASLTSSAILIASVIVVREAAAMLSGIPAGIAVDRYDRKRVMAVVDWLRFLALGLLGLACAFDITTIWMLWVVAIVLGSGDSVFSPASFALMPALVEEEQLDVANGRFAVAETIAMELIGPPVGALLFAAAAFIPMFLDAGSFLISGLIILSIATVTVSKKRERAETIREELSEGLRFVWHNRIMRTIAGVMFGAALTLQACFAVLVIMARDVLSLSSVEYGLLFTGVAFGGIISGILVGRLVGRWGRQKVLLAVLGFMAFGMAIIGASNSFWIAALGCIILGFASTAGIIVSISLRQQLCPDELRGRVFGFISSLLGLGAMLGALAGGIITEFSGARTTMFSAAGALLVVGLCARSNLMRAPASEQDTATR